MGLFTILSKLWSSSPSFEAPAPISNDEYQRHRQAEIDALERRYDLSTVEGINAIPVPRTKEQPAEGISSPTGKIEYYLMIKAGQYEKTGEVDLALACFRKANELMPMSSTEYGRQPYMRLPRYLRQLRRFDEAREEESRIERLFSSGLVFDFGGDDPKTTKVRAEYDWLWEHLPSVCPKSLSAYSRMKNQKTEKYTAIVAEAAQHGYKIKP